MSPWLLMVLTSLAYPVAAGLILLTLLLVFLPYPPLPRILLALPLAALLTLMLAAALGALLPRTAPPRAPHTTFRLAHLNALFYEHTNMAAKKTFLQTSDADVISLVEVNAEMAALAEAEKARYPYQLSGGTDNAPGGHLPILILSRYPMQLVAAVTSRMRLYQVQLPSGPITILQTHPQSPYIPAMHQYRNQELAALASLNLPSPLLMVGDLNTTPWDPALAPLRQKLTLRGTYLPTFPARAPLTPIDLLLTSGLPAPTLTRLHIPGTDHLALLADFPL